MCLVSMLAATTCICLSRIAFSCCSLGFPLYDSTIIPARIIRESWIALPVKGLVSNLHFLLSRKANRWTLGHDCIIYGCHEAIMQYTVTWACSLISACNPPRLDWIRMHHALTLACVWAAALISILTHDGLAIVGLLAEKLSAALALAVGLAWWIWTGQLCCLCWLHLFEVALQALWVAELSCLGV